MFSLAAIRTPFYPKRTYPTYHRQDIKDLKIKIKKVEQQIDRSTHSYIVFGSVTMCNTLLISTMMFENILFDMMICGIASWSMAGFFVFKTAWHVRKHGLYLDELRKIR